MNKQYYSPSELLQEPSISEIFSRPQEIGFFARLFSDKMIMIKTERSILIEKSSFLRLIQAIEQVETGNRVVLP